jgi:hypothetical protein
VSDLRDRFAPDGRNERQPSPREFLRRHAQAKRTEAALYSWQQTCDEQERELAVLRGALLHAQKVVDSFDRKPTDDCTRDVIGLAESLRRYREMRDGTPSCSLPKVSQNAW